MKQSQIECILGVKRFIVGHRSSKPSLIDLTNPVDFRVHPKCDMVSEMLQDDWISYFDSFLLIKPNDYYRYAEQLDLSLTPEISSLTTIMKLIKKGFENNPITPS
jgi:hypothetical protein